VQTIVLKVGFAFSGFEEAKKLAIPTSNTNTNTNSNTNSNTNNTPIIINSNNSTPSNIASAAI
jgi:hypothetical protein